MGYNPASLRVRTSDGTFNLSGIVTLVFPNGTVQNWGRGVVAVGISPPLAETVLKPALSTDAADGSRTTFHFATPVQSLLIPFVGGLADFTPGWTVVDGAIVSPYVINPPDNVGALYIPA